MTIRLCCTHALLVLLLSVAGCQRHDKSMSQGGQDIEWLTDSLSVHRQAQGLWIHTTWKSFSGGNRFPSNGLIIVKHDHVVLVDTAWGEEPTELLLNWIERELALPVRHVIITHFHEDRLGGVPVLERLKVPYYLSPMTARLAKSNGANLNPLLLDLAEPGDAQVLESVEVFYPGPAHTRDNIVVYLNAQSTLFGGCAIRPLAARTAGNVADADVSEWPVSISRMQRRYPSVSSVVPSHGDTDGPELLAHTIAIMHQHLTR